MSICLALIKSFIAEIFVYSFVFGNLVIFKYAVFLYKNIYSLNYLLLLRYSVANEINAIPSKKRAGF